MKKQEEKFSGQINVANGEVIPAPYFYEKTRVFANLELANAWAGPFLDKSFKNVIKAFQLADGRVVLYTSTLSHR